MARTVAMPSAIASMRVGVSVSRSRKEAVMPLARASATSSALAARIVCALARTARSMASSARFFCSVGASDNTRAAARARPASSVIRAGKSALPSIAFRDADIVSSKSRLRPCPSTEFTGLARLGTGVGCLHARPRYPSEPGLGSANGLPSGTISRCPAPADPPRGHRGESFRSGRWHPKCSSRRARSGP